MEDKTLYLITGYLQNSLSDEEADLFYKWLEDSTDNKKLYFDLKAIYDASKSLNSKHDINQIWERLLRKRNKKQPVRLKKYLSLFKYAAVACMAVISTILLQQPNHTDALRVQYKTGNGISADVIILPDGTEVSLGAETEFIYSTDYLKNNRTVYLNGEAYFDVKADPNSPFTVKIDGQDIVVLGTKFNIMAYSADSTNITTLVEGSVKLLSGTMALKETILSPNQQLIFNKNSNEELIQIVPANQYANWIDGYYYFEKQSLEDILNKIGRLYSVEFFFESPGMKDKMFRGTFYRGQSLEQILEVINLSIGMKYKTEGRKVYIYNK